MSFNPSRIINSRINTLRSTASDLGQNLQSNFEEQLPLLDVSRQLRSTSLRVMDRAEVGINDISSSFQESLGNLSNIVPGALGNVAQGVGATLGRVDDVLGGIRDFASEGFTGLANSALANVGDRVENFLEIL